MSAKQISIFLENRPGTLDKMTEVLANHDINIRALSLADTKDFGIVRMLVDDVFAATTVLKEENFLATLTPVLIFAISDETGGLNKLLKNFTEVGVNIEYMYAFAGKKNAYMIFRVSDTKAAETAMRAKGFHSLSQEEIADV